MDLAQVFLVPQNTGHRQYEALRAHSVEQAPAAEALKVNCDLQLTLMGSRLYRNLGQRIGNGYQTVKSRHLFRDFINATATLLLDECTLTVQFQRRDHNPLLIAAGFDTNDVRIPWLGNRQLRFQCGSGPQRHAAWSKVIA